MIDIGPIPEGWEREAYLGVDGRPTEMVSSPFLPFTTIHVSGGVGVPYVHVFARNAAGLSLQAAKLVTNGTIASTIQEIAAFLAPSCPAMTPWVQEASCTTKIA